MKSLAALLLLAVGLAAAQEGPKPTLLRTATLVAGNLSVSVYDHEIETRDGMLRCWTYVSKGMEKHGQREIVFTLRRMPDLELWGFPEELLDLFETIYTFAAKGQLVNDNGFTIFPPGAQLLRRKGTWGLMYLPAESFEGIDIPPNALTAILVKDYETELIQHGLHYRVAASLAGSYRYFPYPPWSDPDRSAMVTEERFGKSILSKVPVRTMSGITARTAVEVSVPAEPQPRMTDGQGSFGSQIVLSIDRKSVPDIKAALKEIPKGGVHAWLIGPDPTANSRLHWDVDGKRTIILQPPSGPGSWTTGGFVLLGRAGKGLEEKAILLEDGFAAVLSPRSWKELTEALASGRPIEIRGKGENLSLSVEFAKSEKGVRGKAAAMIHIVLFNSDADFAESGISAYTLSGYMDDIGNAVSEVLSAHAELGADGLLVAVAVRPGSRVKVWCEAAEDGFNPSVLRAIEDELEKVRPPLVRAGTVAFSMSGPRWSAAAEGSPGFPKAWTDVVDRTNRSMTMDEILAILWKD
jgi:hypothetical protein